MVAMIEGLGVRRSLHKSVRFMVLYWWLMMMFGVLLLGWGQVMNGLNLGQVWMERGWSGMKSEWWGVGLEGVNSWLMTVIQVWLVLVYVERKRIVFRWNWWARKQKE